MKHARVVRHAVPHRTQPQRWHGISLVLVAVLAGGCAERSEHGRVLQPGGAERHERAPEAFRVRLDTTRGAIVLEVRRAWAPQVRRGLVAS
jgi:hypothetical protein